MAGWTRKARLPGPLIGQRSSSSPRSATARGFI